MELLAGRVGGGEEGSQLIWGVGHGVKWACASNSEERINIFRAGKWTYKTDIRRYTME